MLVKNFGIYLRENSLKALHQINYTKELADMQSEFYSFAGILRVGRLKEEGKATNEMISILKRNNVKIVRNQEIPGYAWRKWYIR